MGSLAGVGMCRAPAVIVAVAMALALAPGAWKAAAVFKLTDTKAWKTFECTVPDALFKGRCNGADLRFDIHSGDTMPAIASVKITRVH